MTKMSVFRILLQISVGALVLGIVFRIMHWPFGQLLIFGGLLSIFVFSILFYSSKSEKSFFDKLALVLIPLWCLNGLTRLFDVFSAYQSNLRIAFIAIAFLYCAFLAYNWYREDKSAGAKRINFARIGYSLGITLITVGLIFKILHFPLASIILLIGLVASAISFILIMFSKDDTENS